MVQWCYKHSLIYSWCEVEAHSGCAHVSATGTRLESAWRRGGAPAGICLCIRASIKVRLMEQGCDFHCLCCFLTAFLGPPLRFNHLSMCSLVWCCRRCCCRRFRLVVVVVGVAVIVILVVGVVVVIVGVGVLIVVDVSVSFVFASSLSSLSSLSWSLLSSLMSSVSLLSSLSSDCRCSRCCRHVAVVVGIRIF